MKAAGDTRVLEGHTRQVVARPDRSTRERWMGRASFLAPLALVALVLLVLVDDRHVGRAADERQVIWTAVALSETGQLAQARGHDFAYVTADGRAVSRYGIGLSLLQVPAAWLAPHVESRLGPGTSQPLFLVVPLLLVLVSAGLAGVAARQVGAGPLGGAVAIVLCGLGSPLASYAATSFSETLQAVSLAGAFAFALRSVAAETPTASRRAAVLAGVFASLGLLAKSLLVAVAPFALLPLLAASPHSTRVSRLTRAALGAVPGMVLWIAFELVRFGRLFASYPGEGFTHPFADGVWRLLVGPNSGFLLFFPLALVAVVQLARAAGRRDADATLRLGGGVAPLALLLAVSAGWWAWHGVWGWGPRFLVPAVPPLAALAAAGLVRRPTIAWALTALSVAINLPGLLQHPIPITNYYSSLAWPAVSADTARSVAGYAARHDTDGTWHIGPDHVLATIPQASPFLVYPWFARVTRTADADAVARALQSPPWRDAHPDLVPPTGAQSPQWVHSFTGYPRPRGWGRGFAASAEDADYAAVFDEGLADQVLRLQQQRDAAGALALALRLASLAPSGTNDGFVLESYRLLHDAPAAASYLSQLPPQRRTAPTINVVLALFQRGRGDESGARALLESVADRFPADAPLQRALHAPVAEWPDDLQSMIEAPIKLVGERD